MRKRRRFGLAGMLTVASILGGWLVETKLADRPIRVPDGSRKDERARRTPSSSIARVTLQTRWSSPPETGDMIRDPFAFVALRSVPRSPRGGPQGQHPLAPLPPTP